MEVPIISADLGSQRHHWEEKKKKFRQSPDTLEKSKISYLGDARGHTEGCKILASGEGVSIHAKKIV